MPGRILIAHSIAANRVSLKSALKSEYFDVICVPCMETLKAAVLKDKPDLILLPVKLGKEDGYNLCKRMKLNAFFAHIPVVLVLNDKNEINWGRALTSLVDDLFVFPIQKTNMISRLRQLYRHKAEIDALKTHANLYNSTGFNDIAIEKPGDRLRKYHISICTNSPRSQIKLNSNIGQVTYHNALNFDVTEFTNCYLIILDHCSQQNAILAKLKRHPKTRSLPVLCVVNPSKKRDLKNLLELGATDFIQHPFAQDEISTRVKSILGLSLYKNSLNRDIQKRIKEANIDPLTGLYNRRYAHQFLETLFSSAQRNRKNLIALMLDLDNFKSINDQLGHPLGDEVLANLGITLKTNLRDADLIARIGGEEFLILIAGISIEKGEAIAQRLRKCIMNNAINLRTKKLTNRITVSIGVACNSPAHKDSLELIKAADDALYQAKEKGRNCVRVFKAA